jgi:hypothetical protein
MSAKRTALSVLVVLGLVVILASVLLWLNLSHLSRNLAQRAIPGLNFDEITVRWNRIEITEFAYASASSFQTRLAAPSVQVRPAFLSFLREEIEVSRLAVSSPELRLERKRTTETTERSPEESRMVGRQAVFEEIEINKGKGEFIDHLVDGPPARLGLSNVDIRLSDLHYPAKAGAVGIEASANIESEPTGRAELSGWVDTVNRSAEIRLVLTALDLRQLEPYLKGDLQILEDAVGQTDLEVELSMLGGEYRATGEITLSELRVAADGQSRFGRVLLREYLKLRGNRIQVPFEVTGNLDRAEHLLDISALLSGILRPELDLEALEKRIGPEQVQEAERRLRRLRDRGRELKDLFR